MTVAASIERKLTEALKPARHEIEDESARHHGHAGYQEGGETHFRVTVVSQAFAGQNRVARQRLVYKLLAEELSGRVHALALTALTPDEA
jgi:BolA family transcriptional regulator, general stress-responsive regulator